MDSSVFNSDARSRFRLIGLLEGTSFVLLMGIAMPLKYFLGMPMAVTYIGWAHGVLFVAYMLALFWAADKYKWNFGKVALAALASLLPFGPFVLDSRVKNW